MSVNMEKYMDVLEDLEFLGYIELTEDDIYIKEKFLDECSYAPWWISGFVLSGLNTGNPEIMEISINIAREFVKRAKKDYLLAIVYSLAVRIMHNLVRKKSEFVVITPETLPYIMPSEEYYNKLCDVLLALVTLLQVSKPGILTAAYMEVYDSLMDLETTILEYERYERRRKKER